MKLFWVTTDDHHEDWFIVANSRAQAARFHENAEGYDRGDAWAEEVLTIPDHCSAEVGWPSEELLLSLGARFLSQEPSRVVEINGWRFTEGLLEGIIRELDDDRFEDLGRPRVNDTTKTRSD